MFFSRKHEEKIAQLEKKLFRLEQVADSLNREMLVMTLDEAGVITGQNSNSANELGYSQDRVSGRKLLDFVPENARSPPHFKSLKAALEKNRSSRARTCRSGGAEDVRRFSGFLPVLDHARSGGLK